MCGQSSGRKAFFIVVAAFFVTAFAIPAAAATYYVSSSQGNDDNDGLSEVAPLETVEKVNGLDLQSGDRVLFKCGDLWQGEMLYITKSGASGNPISYGSYPEGSCAGKPEISGSIPIAGWSQYVGNIYVANLSAGENAGKFPFGINQLFKNDLRLQLGRWPNLGQDDGGVNFDNGYSFVDASPANNRITDNELPNVDWTGGVIHIKGMRWYILNRDITAAGGGTLTLHSDIDCYDGGCSGWGYFINSHLQTLDQNGEWFYDDSSNNVYLYSASGTPANIEGSVILKDDGRSWGGITLGRDLNDPIAYVTIENLMVKNWYLDGIGTPTNFANTELHHIVIRSNHIKNVDAKGLRLAVWVFGSTDGRPDGWRGGYDITVENNIIDGANHMGVDTYSRNSTFENNVIRNVALMENAGESGIGCGDSGGGQCTESGDGFRIKTGNPDDSGHHNTLRYNRIEKTGYNGVDVFGSNNTLEYNTIVEACSTKGDCGGVRTFGSGNLTGTNVYDLVLRGNIIVDTIGNTDGCKSTYEALFGFGLYIDHYSRNITTEGNTIINSTCHGVLYQNSTGTVTGNTIYNNASSTGGSQARIGSSPSSVTRFQNNILYGLRDNAKTLTADLSVIAGSDNNYFFNPYADANISSSGNKTLAEWQSHSGMDGNSMKNWFVLNNGDAPLSEMFYNDTQTSATLDLGNKAYLDLDQNEVAGSIVLQPFESKVLINNGIVNPVISLADVILALKICAGITVDMNDLAVTDVNADGDIGIAEAVYSLQFVSELRQ